MALFPMQGSTQDNNLSASPGSIDSLSPRSGHLSFITLEPIFFDYAQTTLKDQAKRSLDAAARYIQNQSEVYRILIEGHSDSQASSASNYKLANIRAMAVRDYMASQGVGSTLFQISALGEDFPIDEHWTREGQRRNRHVEIYIIELSSKH